MNGDGEFITFCKMSHFQKGSVKDHSLGITEFLNGLNHK